MSLSKRGRILLLMDRPLLTAAIDDLLKHRCRMVIAGIVGSAAEALNVISTDPVDVVLVDFHLKGRGGLESLGALRSIHPHLPVLMLNTNDSGCCFPLAIHQGANAYITAEHSADQLLQAIDRIAHGGRYVTPDQAERLLQLVDLGPRSPAGANLSIRELQVLHLMAYARSASTISRELNLSVKTVSTYRTRLQEKLGLKTMDELVHFAIHSNL